MLKSIVKRCFKTSNKEEISKFSNIKDWWSLKGEMKVLHSYNIARLEFMKNIVLRYMKTDDFKFLDNMKCLDIGCGGGILSESMSRLGGNVLGIDANNNCIESAKQHLEISELNINYQNKLVEDLDSTNKYDIITSMEVIEHLDNKELFINKISNLLKSNGILFISTINKTNLSYFYNIICAEKISGIVENNTHDYEKFITPEDLILKCNKNNLESWDYKYYIYNPIFDKFELDIFLKTNYVIAFRPN